MIDETLDAPAAVAEDADKKFAPTKRLPYIEGDGEKARLFGTFNHLATMFGAARAIVKAKVLPNGKAVGRMARAINALRPYIEEYEMRIDNITKEHTPAGDAAVTEGERISYKNPLLMATKKADESRVIVHENEAAGLFGIPCPPRLKQEHMPKAIEGTKNDEGNADHQADLLCLFDWPEEE